MTLGAHAQDRYKTIFPLSHTEKAGKISNLIHFNYKTATTQGMFAAFFFFFFHLLGHSNAKLYRAASKTINLLDIKH